MHEPLPPDLSRLGDQLAGAAARRVAERRHRRELLGRMAATVMAAALAFTALHPGILGSAERPSGVPAAAATVAYVPTACDQPRGATFVAARPCGRPGATDVVLSRLARRYAVN